MIAPARHRDANGRFAKNPRPATRQTARQTGKVIPATFIRDANGDIQMSLGQGFDATDANRSRRTRAAVDSGADKHMTASTMTKLREMARDFDRNSSLIHGVLDRFSSHVVGPKLIFEPMTSDKAWNGLAKTWFSDHIGPESDARGMNTLRDQFKLVMRAIGTDGEQLEVFLKDFRIQAIEAHQIATPIDRMQNRFNDNRIVNGVRLNAAGKPTGFWVSKDAHNGFFARADQGRLIQTKNTLWPAYRIRRSQTRGLPIIGPALANFDRLDGYIDNEMLAAEIDACLTFWISRSQDYNNGTAEPGSGEQEVRDPNGDTTQQKLQTIQQGAIFDLTGDETVQQFGANRPGTQFESFIIAGMRMFGASLGFPLELVLLDFSRTNYSSARAAILEAHKFVFEDWQQWLDDYVATPIYRRWIAQAMALGELPFNPEWAKIKWFWPTYPYIDPLKSALAIKELISSGVHTITRELARNGITLEDHVEERRIEVEKFREAGIPTTTLEGAVVAGTVDPYKVLAGDDDASVTSAAPQTGAEE